MAKTEFMNNLTRGIHKVGFQLKKHSPEILITAGVIGTVTSAVMACKATTKINDILEDAKAQIDTIHDGMEAGVVIPPVGMPVPYSKEDGKKDLTIVYAQTGFKLIKLYGPAVLLGTVSLFSIIKSHNIMTTRNAALAAAYATVDKGFKQYRGRVIERFGEELDRELKYNIKAKEVERTIVDEEGNESTIKETIHVAEIDEPSDYARFFDENCPNWSKDPEYNLMFLKSQQAHANRILQAKGHVFLNDVYEMLGIPKTRAGHVVGWIYDKNNPDYDNYIDFGLFTQYGNEIYDERKRAFVNGHERSILLDFNVHGNIYDLIRWRDGL